MKRVTAARQLFNGYLKMTPLKSSLVKSADYDTASSTLTLEFATGKKYAYTGVPLKTYEELTRAESAGQYFNANIRPTFTGALLPEDET